VREAWEAELREHGALTVRRTRGPVLTILAFAGIGVAVGAWLVDVGGWLAIVGAVLTAVGLLTVMATGVQAARPGPVLHISDAGLEVPGRPLIKWSEFDKPEVREAAGQLLVLRVKPRYTERTRDQLGRVSRWARETDRRHFGAHRMRLRTSGPKQAEELADLLRWAARRVRARGQLSD
jgi:hypothetical protein